MGIKVLEMQLQEKRNHILNMAQDSNKKWCEHTAMSDKTPNFRSGVITEKMFQREYLSTS